MFAERRAEVGSSHCAVRRVVKRAQADVDALLLDMALRRAGAYNHPH